MRPTLVRALRLTAFALLLAAGLLSLAGPGLQGASDAPVAQAQDTVAPVSVVTVRGVINPTLAHFVNRSIDAAEQSGAQAVVLQLDTPGGLDSSMRQIIQRILAARIPVIVYVGPPGARAGSAGVYITYAAHVAAMAPNTNIGSATPVAMGESGEQQMSPEMRAKVTNDAIAYIRSLAEQRDRNAAWAEQAVREGANVSAQQALSLGVVDLMANDVPDLLRKLDGRAVETAAGTVALQTAQASTQAVSMNLVDALLHALSDPTIAYLLISLGTMGLFFELSNPGSILPGVVGGICLLLGFYALGTLPVNYAGLLLMGFAFLLFVIDLFAPSHGVLTAGGLVAFVFGSLMLFNVPEAAPWITLSAWTVVGVTATMAGFFLVVARLVSRSQHLKPAAGAEALIGQVGRVRSPLTPAGMVFVDGALWEATAEGGGDPIPAGARVEVLALDGLLLRVRPVRETATEAPVSPPSPNAASVGVKTRP
ncbi:MAG: nodulation protein NfeD [Chloroflexi bacterium]|nr:nodulation protein NfeD [Chloroflexota bacterium]